MRICYVSYEYPTYTGFGGIAFYIQKMATIMSEHGHQVEVVTANPKSTIDFQETNSGILIHYLGVQSSGYFQRKLPNYLISISREKKFDLLESPEYGGDMIGCLDKLPMITKKYVVRLHGITLLSMIHDKKLISEKLLLYTIAYIGKYDLLAAIAARLLPKQKKLIRRNQAERKVAQRAEVITIPSLKMNDFIFKFWALKNKRIDKIPNPAPFSPELRSTFSTTKIVVGYVNRCQYLKGFDMFLNLVRHFKRDSESEMWVEFMVYGAIEEKDKKDLTEQLGEFNNGTLSIFGRVPASTLRSAYKKIDCLIIPSRYESFSNVLLEGMSKGCIVCASDGVGAAEIIEDGVNGFVFRSGNMQSLLDTFQKVLYLDPQSREAISGNAVATIANEFSNAKIYQYYSRTYLS